MRWREFGDKIFIRDSEGRRSLNMGVDDEGLVFLLVKPSGNWLSKILGSHVQLDQI